MRQTGIISRLETKYKFFDVCAEQLREKAAMKVVTLSDIQIVIYIFAAGLVVAMVTFLFELCFVQFYTNSYTYRNKAL